MAGSIHSEHRGPLFYCTWRCQTYSTVLPTYDVQAHATCGLLAAVFKKLIGVCGDGWNKKERAGRTIPEVDMPKFHENIRKSDDSNQLFRSYYVTLRSCNFNTSQFILKAKREHRDD